MVSERSFPAGEAGFITGVNASTQQVWRHRGYLPQGEGKWTRHTLRDLCRIRLLKALIDAGVPAGNAAVHLTDEFLSMMQSARKGAEHPQVYAEQFALIACRGREFFYTSAVGLDDVAQKMRTEFDPGFTTCLVINLSALSAEMNERINVLIRHEQFEQEAAGLLDEAAS